MKFFVAQRGNCCGAGGQDFQVYLDNTLLGTFRPSSTGYEEMVTANFSATASAHTLKFVGLNSLGGDNTAFIDHVRVESAGGQSAGGITTGSGSGLSGQYFDNSDFTNLAVTRTDATINFDWGMGTPYSWMGADTFAVRWTGQVQARYSETYTFYTVTDDGVRLWVNNQLIIDRWQDQAPTEWAGTITLQAGQRYDLRLEFYENGGGAMARLLWSSASQAKEVIPQSQLYPQATYNPATDFSGIRNPAGAWSYGYRTSAGAPFQLYPNSAGDQTAGTWYTTAISDPSNTPQVSRSAGSQVVHLHPGPQGQQTVVRWTAPTAGNVESSGRFENLNNATTDVYVRHNAAAIFNGYVNGVGSAVPFSIQRSVAAGDTIEFVVGDGGNGPHYDSTGLVATLVVTQTSETTPPPTADFSPPRLEPRNRTGQPGVDTGSQNINWSVPLVSLPGRAGLDLNLTLAYNSLVWTKSQSGQAIMFDADHGYPSPGFRLGLPIIQPQFYNSEAGVYSYMMVTSTGGRVELRQVNWSNVYEAADGSYMQLIDYGNGSALVRTSDGTMMSFVSSVNGEMRCAQIKDRNGNYISLSYDGNGNISQMTDTLGRVINFNYDGNGRLLSITQPRGGSTYTWATFEYGSLYMQPSFPGLTVYGPQNSWVSVLTRVNLPDGASHRFDYTPFGQVAVIRRYAADNQQLAYTSYNLGTGAHADCPRFSEERRWILWGVMNQSAEVVTSYNAAPDGSWMEVTLPDGTVLKEFFHTTGWQRGLTSQTEVWSGGVRRKWTTIAWTQDNPYVSYKLNPRPIETNVYDAEGNRRRTTIDYVTVSGITLPAQVREYAADGATVVRRRETQYRWDEALVSRRILGVVWMEMLFAGESALVAKLNYHHDWNDANHFNGEMPAVGHDTANYGAGFVWGRGNVTGVRRYNVNAPEDETQAVWLSLMGYNAAGLPFRLRDAAGHATNISYADAFADGVNRGTLAYPTTVTDADGFSATMQYRYDTGAVTRAADPLGAAVVRQYDGADRLARESNQVNGAYTRFVYPTAGHYVVSHSTVRSLNEEVFAATFFDGIGQVRAIQAEMPNSAGGYRAVHFMNDALGRRVWQAHPIEINASWEAVGADAAGWQWTQQAYDWQGRPTVTTFPDGQTREVSYGGCGCAGGEVVTARDERGRRRRLTHDVLGRLAQVEELNWNQSVYATTSYSYNARDQLLQINQAGQPRSFEYDGHGRLWRRTTPEQGETTYSYFHNDRLQTLQDGRGASQTFAYNGRHLVTGISYGVPAGVAATPNVSFSYDAAGNRTGMTDGLGSVSYSYDTLSRLTSETRSFTGVGSFTLSYGYNLAGQLTSITNPWGAQVGYTRDRTGQVTQVTGANYAGVATYASNLQYRATGALKWLEYGNGLRLGVGYDTRLRLTSWNVTASNGVSVLGSAYGYAHFGEQSGRVTFAQSLTGGDSMGQGADRTRDRSFDYDHLGRLIYSTAGSNARNHVGLGDVPQHDGPYSQGYAYDVWGNLTERQGWGGENAAFTASYTNNRRAGATYDAAGNITNDRGSRLLTMRPGSRWLYACWDRTWF